ncbi:hypothetical protein CRV24_000547 [Beauveria bassiana]|nr:hypothetical protein CRV24_000547 [Beauveria bassiana]
MTLVDNTTSGRMEGVGDKILVMAARSQITTGARIRALFPISTFVDRVVGSLHILALPALEEVFHHHLLRHMNKAGVPKALTLVFTATVLVKAIISREVVTILVVDGIDIGRLDAPR